MEEMRCDYCGGVIRYFEPTLMSYLVREDGSIEWESGKLEGEVDLSYLGEAECMGCAKKFTINGDENALWVKKQ